ncbi:MAG: HEAT repeat domain-containing protein [Acidobacteria bacterium]|nr:HEAT repeat domain-containing protein [Acidobacteriota bacterium]
MTVVGDRRTGVRALVVRLFGRPDEIARTAALAGSLFLVIGSYVALKAVRDALYIDAFGAMRLPFVIVGIALVVAVFAELYIRLARRIAVAPLAIGMMLAHALTLVALWACARSGARWLYPVLYLWVGAFGVMAPVQVWMLAQEVFSAREARRLFGPLGAGGVAGAIAGGAVTGVLAQHLGTLSLLLVSALAVTVCAGLIWLVARGAGAGWRPQPSSTRPCSLTDSFRTISRSPHLKNLAALIYFSAIVTTIVDFQFKAIAGGAGLDRDQLASFFGVAYSAMAFASLAVQLFVVRAVLRRFGIGAAVLALPLALAGGTVLLIGSAALWAAVALKSGDGALKHSLDRSAKELAYLPVPQAIKAPVKSAIDMVADRAGDGSGGLVLLVLATGLGLTPSTLAWLNLALIAGWVVLAIRVRRSYVDELASSRVDAEDWSVAPPAFLRESQARLALRRALGGLSEGETIAGLELAALSPGADLVPDLQRLVAQGPADVRARALRVLLDPTLPGARTELGGPLEISDQETLTLALDVVIAEPGEVADRARSLVGADPPAAAAMRLGRLYQRLGPDFEPVALGLAEALTSVSVPLSARVAGASALGLAPWTGSAAKLVERLLDDPEPEVRAAAADSAARLRQPDAIAGVVPLLGERRTRAAAQRALVLGGPQAVPPLTVALASSAIAPAIRVHAAAMLGVLGTPAAIAALTAALDDPDPEVREACLSALITVRRQRPDDMQLDERTWIRLVREQARRCRWLARSLGQAETLRPADVGDEFLAQVVRENLDRSVQRVLRLLELRLPPEHAPAIRRGLSENGAARRDHALELLDELLPGELRAAIVPVLEQVLRHAPGAAPGAAPAPPAAGPDADGLHVVDRVIALKSVATLREVPADELARLAWLAREVRCETGQTLPAAAERDTLLIVLAGRVGFPGADGVTLQLAPEDGSWVMSLPGGAAEPVALAPTHALILRHDEFLEVLSERGEIASRIVDGLIRRGPVAAAATDLATQSA